MEEKKKKRRRKRPTENNLKKSEKNYEIIKAEAKEAASYVDPVEYNYSAVERINAVPDIRDVMKPNALTNLAAKYGYMTPEQLKEASEDPNTTCFERMQMERMAMGVTPRTKSGFTASQAIIDRIEGKPKERHEHSGPDGRPIVLAAQKAEENLQDMIKVMTPEERKKWMKVVEEKRKLEAKVRERRGNGES